MEMNVIVSYDQILLPQLKIDSLLVISVKNILYFITFLTNGFSVTVSMCLCLMKYY